MWHKLTSCINTREIILMSQIIKRVRSNLSPVQYYQVLSVARQSPSTFESDGQGDPWRIRKVHGGDNHFVIVGVARRNRSRRRKAPFNIDLRGFLSIIAMHLSVF